MKIKSTLTFLTMLSIAFLLMNNAGGPASVQGLDRTGSPLSPGSCNTAGCHDAGAFDPTVSIEVLTNNMAISGYEPGASYQIKVTITPSSGTPDRYGFQTVVLDENDDNGGDWSFFPNGGQQYVEFANGVGYMEHASPSTSNTFTTALWEAPAAGGGDVTVYVGAVAANGNEENTGDGAAVASVTLTEGFMVATNDLAESFDFSVFPNPVQDLLNVKINSRTSGAATMRISDVAGKIIQTESFDLHQGENVKKVDTGNLNNGLYLIYLLHDSEVIMETLVKM